MSTIPHLVIAPMSREIIAHADRLPDGELLEIAVALRTLADEVMHVVDRRLGRRPRPHLVVDNTCEPIPGAATSRTIDHGHDRAG